MQSRESRFTSERMSGKVLRLNRDVEQKRHIGVKEQNPEFYDKIEDDLFRYGSDPGFRDSGRHK